VCEGSEPDQDGVLRWWADARPRVRLGEGRGGGGGAGVYHSPNPPPPPRYDDPSFERVAVGEGLNQNP
jgi:hypothetical protein